MFDSWELAGEPVHVTALTNRCLSRDYFAGNHAQSMLTLGNLPPIALCRPPSSPYTKINDVAVKRLHLIWAHLYGAFCNEALKSLHTQDTNKILTSSL